MLTELELRQWHELRDLLKEPRLPLGAILSNRVNCVAAFLETVIGTGKESLAAAKIRAALKSYEASLRQAAAGLATTKRVIQKVYGSEWGKWLASDSLQSRDIPLADTINVPATVQTVEFINTAKVELFCTRILKSDTDEDLPWVLGPVVCQRLAVVLFHEGLCDEKTQEIPSRIAKDFQRFCTRLQGQSYLRYQAALTLLTILSHIAPHRSTQLSRSFLKGFDLQHLGRMRDRLQHLSSNPLLRDHIADAVNWLLSDMAPGVSGPRCERQMTPWVLTREEQKHERPKYVESPRVFELPPPPREAPKIAQENEKITFKLSPPPPNAPEFPKHQQVWHPDASGALKRKKQREQAGKRGKKRISPGEAAEREAIVRQWKEARSDNNKLTQKDFCAQPERKITLDRLKTCLTWHCMQVHRGLAKEIVITKPPVKLSPNR